MLIQKTKEAFFLKMPLLEIKTPLGVKIIKTSEIVYIIAEKKHSQVLFSDKSTLETSHSVKWYTEALIKPIFFRCHHSYIVNCLYVDCFNAEQLIMNDGSRVPFSRHKKEEFRANMKHIHKS